MSMTDGSFFVQISGTSPEPPLHLACGTSREEGEYTLLFQVERELDLKPGQKMYVYHFLNYRFVKHFARITACSREVCPAGSRYSVTVSLVGEPLPAENRRSYRVSTCAADLMVQVGDSDLCPLMDVSTGGLSFASENSYDIGSEVPVTLWFDGRMFVGRCRIQNRREFERGQHRYGVYCTDVRHAVGSLAEGLQYMSVLLQREQLSRLARLR
jgi:hypothetical protein